MGAIVFATQFAMPKKQGDGNDSETIRQQHGFAILCSDETLRINDGFFLHSSLAALAETQAGSSLFLLELSVCAFQQSSSSSPRLEQRAAVPHPSFSAFS